MKNTKKFLSILLALVLMLAPMTVGITASAANDMIFKVSSVKKAKPGQEVTIKVTLENSKNVCVVNPTVEYDADKLEFLSATNGDVFKSNAFKIGAAREGKVRILYYNGVTDTSKNGTVCTLKFKVLDNAEGYADVSLDFPENSVVDSKEKAVSFDNESGTVQIVSPVIHALRSDETELTKENANPIEDGKYYQKVPLFARYRAQSVKLMPELVGDTVKSVEWSVDTNRLLVDEDGVVTPNRPWYCRANITAKITNKNGEVFEKTVMVEFFKLGITKRLPVF